ncbi:uncharacterized protein B0P05DRAFT_558408 [Gilbertella persicaria]|uniref:uncharacterized protein n=1 Tax=Gilbertella persicaria TaxID=101096 RepID=UPI00221EC465|nr:uncharacterized protein B0P05DRAFT_558408 [Gilbertella persicaria]KAI8059381.1 hypothetical protein B0P05DRAFT_558408 [Gilbertella persicaria]
MIFSSRSQSQKQPEENSIKPMKILTNALVSVSTTHPITSSLPFPIDEVPVRRVKTNESMLDINDPKTFRPRPSGIHVNLILQHANCTGWLTKHRAPTFSFIKTIKKRYVVLVDRFLYSFKTETPETYREFLELTKNTHAFATDKFTGALFCIEIKKMGHEDSSSWFLQVEDAESMKMWLDKIKRTIALIRADHATTITSRDLSHITTEEQEYSLIAARPSISTSSQSNISLEQPENDSIWLQSSHSSSIGQAISQPSSPILSSPINENESLYSYPSSVGFSSEYSIERQHSYDPPRRHSSLRTSNHSNSHIPAVLPPQLPPPKTQPPPIPSYAYL